MNNIDIKPVVDTGTGAFPKSLLDYFGSFERMNATSRSDIEELQLTVLKKRFESLRNNVPTLKKLADAQRVDEVNTFDDVVSLLFSHTVYKSYPISLLEKNRFTQLTKWLQKLCITDLSGVDVSHCQGIDEWFVEMDRQTPLTLRHSSGTTGAMSFIPRTARETEEYFLNLLFQVFGVAKTPGPTRENPISMHVVLPTYRSGNYGTLRTNTHYLKYVAGGDESKMHVLYPRHQSSDMLFLAGRIAAAKANGELEKLELSPTLLARKAEFESIQKDMGNDLEKFMADIVNNLKGQKVYAMVLSNQLSNLSSAGLSKGLSNIFHPDSVLMTGGGAKGQALPPDWKDEAKKFFGVSEIVHTYGMSELMAAHNMCSHGRYHASNSAILFVLDPDTGAALPRKGVRTGRAAFFDLMADTYWGGFVTGDEITVDWDTPCPCGIKSAHIAPQIERYSAKRGGDDKITCAAAAEAHDEALYYLTESAVI
jgi:hypothetical protein